jgi:hypothetical protein
MKSEPNVLQLTRLVGNWTTEATHPALPGVVVRGTVEISWLEGERFLIHRARNENPDFPDSISIIGQMGDDRLEEGRSSTPGESDAPMSMHYFDSRGVFRSYSVSFDASEWRIWREAAGFSQRFSGQVSDGGDTIVGKWELRPDDVNWADDLEITYRRR